MASESYRPPDGPPNPFPFVHDHDAGHSIREGNFMTDIEARDINLSFAVPDKWERVAHKTDDIMWPMNI
jgi:tellurite resistance-related uncharacterized protein